MEGRGGHRHKVMLRRFVLQAPPGFDVDYKEPGNILDCTRANLRIATRANLRQSPAPLPAIRACTGASSGPDGVR